MLQTQTAYCLAAAELLFSKGIAVMTTAIGHLVAFERFKLKMLKNLLTFYMYAIKRSFYDLTPGNHELPDSRVSRSPSSTGDARTSSSTVFDQILTAIIRERGISLTGERLAPNTPQSPQASSGSYANLKIASFKRHFFDFFEKLRDTVFSTPKLHHLKLSEVLYKRCGRFESLDSFRPQGVAVSRSM